MRLAAAAAAAAAMLWVVGVEVGAGWGRAVAEGG
jgi:hypothetical protein